MGNRHARQGFTVTGDTLRAAVFGLQEQARSHHQTTHRTALGLAPLEQTIRRTTDVSGRQTVTGAAEEGWQQPNAGSKPPWRRGRRSRQHEQPDGARHGRCWIWSRILIRGQKSAVRGQKSEVRSQRSEPLIYVLCPLSSHRSNRFLRQNPYPFSALCRLCRSARSGRAQRTARLERAQGR